MYYLWGTVQYRQFRGGHDWFLTGFEKKNSCVRFAFTGQHLQRKFERRLNQDEHICSKVGYEENALGQCTSVKKGECNYDTECPEDKACIEHSYRDPCKLSDLCGQDAICEISAHRPVCRCPEGWGGVPTTQYFQYSMFNANASQCCCSIELIFKFLCKSSYSGTSCSPNATTNSCTSRESNS